MKENQRDQKDKDQGQKGQKPSKHAKKEEKHQNRSRRESDEYGAEEDMEDCGRADSSDPQQQQPKKLSKGELKRLERQKRQNERDEQKRMKQMSKEDSKLGKKKAKDKNSKPASDDASQHQQQPATSAQAAAEKAAASHSPEVFTPMHEYPCSLSNYGGLMADNYNRIYDIQIDHEDRLKENHQATLMASNIKQVTGQQSDYYQKSQYMSTAGPLNSIAQEKCMIAGKGVQGQMGVAVAHNFEQYNDKSEQEKHSQMARSHSTDQILHNSMGDANNNEMLQQNPNLVTISNDNSNQNINVNEALGTKKQQSKRGKKKKGEQTKLENGKNKNGADSKQEFLTLKLQKIDVEQKSEGNFEHPQNHNHQGLTHDKGINQQIGPNHHHQQNEGIIQHGGVEPGAEQFQMHQNRNNQGIQNIIIGNPIEPIILQNCYLNMQFPQQVHHQHQLNEQYANNYLQQHGMGGLNDLQNSYQSFQKNHSTPDNEMINPDPNCMNNFAQFDSFSPNRAILANEMKYYPGLNQVNALYSTNTAGVEANISPQQNQFSYVNHNQMPNCVKTDAQQTITMTETSKECSSIMQIQPVPVMMNHDNSNGMEQNIYSHHAHNNYVQQPVTEWTPMMVPIQMSHHQMHNMNMSNQNFHQQQSSHQAIKPSQLTLQHQIKSVDAVNSLNPYKHQIISPRVGANPDDFLAPNSRPQPEGPFGGADSNTPKAQLMMNKSKSMFGPSSSQLNK